MGEKTPNFPLYPVLIMFAIFALLLVGLLAGQPKIPPATRIAPTEVAVEPTATAAPTEVAVNVTYSNEDITEGQALFQTSCSACHGTEGRGISGLGKDLIDSEFVHGLTDPELHEFIVVGRSFDDPLNTTGIMMPPKGGNPALDDNQIDQIIAFIRSRSAGSTQIVAEPTTVLPENREPFVLPIAGLDFTNVVLPEREFDVAEAYALSCAGCHGVQGEGGSASAVSAWDMSDEEIFALLTELHPPVDPETGFAHPVRGEHPALTDDQLHELIDYLHTLPTD